MVRKCSDAPSLEIVVYSALLPLAPGSLPPFNNRARPTRILLGFTSDHHTLLAIRERNFVMTPSTYKESNYSLRCTIEMISRFRFQTRIFNLDRTNLVRTSIAMRALNINIRSNSPRNRPVITSNTLTHLGRDATGAVAVTEFRRV